MTASAGAGGGVSRSSIGLPSWFLLLGLVLLVGALMLDGRLIWEMTALTWREGPQMVGFSLVHGDSATLIVAPFVLAPWVIAASASLAWRWWRQKDLDRSSWAVVITAIAAIGLFFVPQAFWTRIFVARIARSPGAVPLLLEAAGEGSLGTVRSLVARGVPINARDRRDGQTALYHAAAGCKAKVAAFLIEGGADAGILDFAGDSPLAVAEDRHCTDVSNLLQARGAPLVRASEAQRDEESSREIQSDVDNEDRTFRRVDPDSAASNRKTPQ